MSPQITIPVNADLRVHVYAQPLRWAFQAATSMRQVCVKAEEAMTENCVGNVWKDMGTSAACTSIRSSRLRVQTAYMCSHTLRRSPLNLDASSSFQTRIVEGRKAADKGGEIQHAEDRGRKADRNEGKQTQTHMEMPVLRRRK